MLQELLTFFILQPRYIHDARGNKCISKDSENGDHVGCGDTDCRIILKLIRKTCSGNVTGLNSLKLRASLVAFMKM
jgi:hypothetical protein